MGAMKELLSAIDGDMQEMEEERIKDIQDMITELSSAYRSVEDATAIAFHSNNLHRNLVDPKEHCKRMLDDAAEKINIVCTKLEEKIS